MDDRMDGWMDGSLVTGHSRANRFWDSALHSQRKEPNPARQGGYFERRQFFALFWVWLQKLHQISQDVWHCLHWTSSLSGRREKERRGNSADNRQYCISQRTGWSTSSCDNCSSLKGASAGILGKREKKRIIRNGRSGIAFNTHDASGWHLVFKNATLAKVFFDFLFFLSVFFNPKSAFSLWRIISALLSDRSPMVVELPSLEGWAWMLIPDLPARRTLRRLFFLH